MKGFSIVLMLVVVLFSCLSVRAGEPVGEGGSYVPKQEAETESQQTNEPSIKTFIENIYKQQGQQLLGQWGQQELDAAKMADGTWQLQGQIQTVAGTLPYSATETWKWDAKQGILYINGWMWRGKTAGNYLQVQTQIETGARAMLTIQFLDQNNAVCSMNVGATATLSPCMGQYRAVRVQ